MSILTDSASIDAARDRRTLAGSPILAAFLATIPPIEAKEEAGPRRGDVVEHHERDSRLY